MPKKSPRRSSKARNRVRRPAGVQSGAVPLEVEEVPTAAPARPAPASPPRSRGARPPARRTTSIVDYTYLTRDIRTLAVLAPLMVVLVLLSFVFLH